MDRNPVASAVDRLASRPSVDEIYRREQARAGMLLEDTTDRGSVASTVGGAASSQSSDGIYRRTGSSRAGLSV